MRTFQIVGFVAAATVWAAVAVVWAVRARQAAAGTRFRCSAGLVDLRDRRRPRFMRLGFTRLDLTADRFQVALMIELGHHARSSISVERPTVHSINLAPVEVSSTQRALSFGVAPEMVGRVVLKTGEAMTMSFVLSVEDGRRLGEAGPGLGWPVVVDDVVLPSPLSAPVSAFDGWPPAGPGT